MRRWSPILFAGLTVLFAAERAVNSGALSGVMRRFGGVETATLRNDDAGCARRDTVLGALEARGVRLAPEPAPFCTDRADVADWVAAANATGTNHLAFDGRGCLAVWEQAACP